MPMPIDSFANVPSTINNVALGDGSGHRNRSTPTPEAALDLFRSPSVARPPTPRRFRPTAPRWPSRDVRVHSRRTSSLPKNIPWTSVGSSGGSVGLVTFAKTWERLDPRGSHGGIAPASVGRVTSATAVPGAFAGVSWGPRAPRHTAAHAFRNSSFRYACLVEHHLPPGHSATRNVQGCRRLASQPDLREPTPNPCVRVARSQTRACCRRHFALTSNTCSKPETLNHTSPSPRSFCRTRCRAGPSLQPRR
jgi:hypothetical protein